MPLKTKGKAKVTLKESKESYSQDSIKTPSWFELIQKNEKASSSSSKTRTLDQKALTESATKRPPIGQSQDSDQKVSVETIEMLSLVSIDDIARINALVLANIFYKIKRW